MKQTPVQIRMHEKMLKPDNQPHQLVVIQNWVKRVDLYDSVETRLSQVGRKKLLNPQEEKVMTRLVRKNCKKVGVYTVVKRKMGFSGTRRTLNNYGLKNGFRE
jgi:hypothetical protein